MTKRERNIAIVVGAAVGLFMLDRVLISPLLASRADLNNQIAAAKLAFEQDKTLISRRADLESKWRQNQTHGLVFDSTSALSQLSNTINQLATEVGMREMQITPSANPIQPAKPGGKSGEKVKGFLKLSCRFNANGSMQQISSLIWRLQNANVPMRITELEIKTEREMFDDLVVSLTASTIFIAPETPGRGGETVTQATPATNRAGTPNATQNAAQSAQPGARGAATNPATTARQEVR